MEQQRLEIAGRARVSVQSGKGEVLPRIEWYKTDLGVDPGFREWLQRLMELAPMLPFKRPADAEGTR